MAAKTQAASTTLLSGDTGVIKDSMSIVDSQGERNIAKKNASTTTCTTALLPAAGTSRLGAGAQLVSLSVLVLGLIGTVTVSLNIALFFTIISSFTIITIVWNFVLIRYHTLQQQSQQQQQKQNQQQNYQPSINTSISFVVKPSSSSQTLVQKTVTPQEGSRIVVPVNEANFQVIKIKAASQVENYLFTLLWILSLSDWFFTTIVLSLNSHFPYLDLSLNYFVWGFQVITCYFLPTLIQNFFFKFYQLYHTHTEKLNSNNSQHQQDNYYNYSYSESCLPPNKFIFLYLLFIRKLGCQFFSSYFPGSVFVQLTSLCGIILGKSLNNYIVSVTSIFNSTNNFPSCNCTVNQQSDSILTDYSENPANLRRRSSENGNGIALLSGLGSVSYNNSSSTTTTTASSSSSCGSSGGNSGNLSIKSNYNPLIPSINLPQDSCGSNNSIGFHSSNSNSPSSTSRNNTSSSNPDEKIEIQIPIDATATPTLTPTLSPQSPSSLYSSTSTLVDLSSLSPSTQNINITCENDTNETFVNSCEKEKESNHKSQPYIVSSITNKHSLSVTEGLGSAISCSTLPCSSINTSNLTSEEVDKVHVETSIKIETTTTTEDKQDDKKEDEDRREEEEGETEGTLLVLNPRKNSVASSCYSNSYTSSIRGEDPSDDQDRLRRASFHAFSSLSRCHSATHIVSSSRNSELEKMRRTSLPALPAQKQIQIQHGSNTGVDTAILLEAHGLVTDMLMEHAVLPPNIVCGLRALATLLTPPPLPLHYQNSSRPKPAPILLSTDPEYTSDIDEIPYTGEKIWNMPKRNSGPTKKGGVSANLLRRMSTSTWTTTTSATGMPTLEPQPHSRRRRSASFRNPLDGTSQSSSPTHPLGISSEATAMRIQSMIAASSAHIPNAALQASHKSRSFSANALYASSDNRRRFSQQELTSSQRKTLCSLHPLSPSDLTHLKALANATAASCSVLSSPAGTPIPSPLPSPLPSRDPSPSIPDCSNRRSSSPPKLLYHPRSSSFTVTSGGAGEDGAPGKPYLENPDDDCSTASTLGDGPGPPSNEISSSHRLSPVTFTLQEPTDDQPLSSNDEESGDVLTTPDGWKFDLSSIASDPLLNRLSEWDYPIFELESSSNTQILSHMCYKVFLDVGLFETFKIPIKEFINYFHALEMGYRDKPYHNRMHAADVLHGVYYLTSQPIPGFEMLLSDPETPCASDAQVHRWFSVEESSYGIMGANFPALELMAIYVAAAMHDYDHPGRTNAFLVTTHAPQAIFYNDRSVLENHHAAAAWSLLLSNDDCNFLKYLDKAEFKRFRYLVIEAILATDLKRHFEILAEFNAKANDDSSPGIDWNLEADRLLVMEMCIKLADINGPCKYHDIHVRWTYRIAEEFYEQGDEEEELGLPISPYMDRKHPQLAKLQESFINHLVAPLCKACAEAGILPGYWEDEDETGDEVSSCQETDENDSSYSDDNSESKKCKRKIVCLQTKHLQDNHKFWMNVIKEENRKKEEGVKTESVAISTEDIMETIEEENNTPHSLNRSFSFEKEDSKL